MRLDLEYRAESLGGNMSTVSTDIISFHDVSKKDIATVGGKNASLGEMISKLTKAGIKVPPGFATTADAFRSFLKQNDLAQKIYALLHELDVEDLPQLKKVGNTIRNLILNAPFSPAFIEQVRVFYTALSQNNELDCAVAVRSSATAEDLPEASFAGQQESFLNVQGFQNVLVAIKQVYASLFNDRAIAYRVHHRFSHQEVALSVGVQKMVRSDLAASGVMFTLDTESGFDQVVFITASYGLGEMIVQGEVNPDEFYVHKPTLLANRHAILRKNIGSKQWKLICNEQMKPSADGLLVSEGTLEKCEVPDEEKNKFSLSDEEIAMLARQAILIEQHYGCPMDIEWAKDGLDGTLYILQARPETVKSRTSFARVIERFHLEKEGKKLIEGRSVGQRIGCGQVRVVNDLREMEKVQQGDVLVADFTDPDWEPIMKRASAIVTNRGGRTCHAAIIARELGIPAVVGCHNATSLIKEGQVVTVSCAQGEVGIVYEGRLPYQVKKIELDNMPELPLKLMMNVGNPERAFDFSCLPNQGVGLARLEFIIGQTIGIHPAACFSFDNLPVMVKEKIERKIVGYKTPRDFYVQKMIEGIATIAAAFYPKQVIVRCSDFKSNEYAHLLGGQQFEPNEENPMLGFRGASRYIAPQFEACFALECEALRFVREDMGFQNIAIMIPFVRTLTEAVAVHHLLEKNGLKRGEQGLKVMMMCELPSNAILADSFLEYFDGFSIGSNDLTQLTLGCDRDSGLLVGQFDERNEAVKFLMERAILACKKQGKYIGICGQGPSDHLDLAMWLVSKGIDSLSLNPDSILETWLSFSEKAEVLSS